MHTVYSISHEFVYSLWIGFIQIQIIQNDKSHPGLGLATDRVIVSYSHSMLTHIQCFIVRIRIKKNCSLFLILPQFVFLTYILGLAWLGIFGFSAVPVFLFYNMWNTCAAMKSPVANLTSIDNICVDVRQYGE